MNHEPILEALAAKPGMRSVDIADKLDRDTVEVEAALLALIKIGHVAVGEGTGANGKATIVYNLTDAYLASDEAATLRAKALLANFRVEGWDTMSRAEKAIAFVRDRGTATAAELHVVMGLPADQYVSVALSHVITSGRLTRGGKNWKLGPNASTADPKAQASAADAVRSMVGAVVTADDVKDLPPALTAEMSKPARQLATTTPPRPPIETPRFLPSGTSAEATTADDLAAAMTKDSAPSAAPASQFAEANAIIEKRANGLSPAEKAIARSMERSDEAEEQAPRQSRANAVFGDQVADAPAVDPIELPAPPVETNSPPTRFAIWSDGMFEVQRNGQTVLMLSEDELGDMLHFIASARGAA